MSKEMEQFGNLIKQSSQGNKQMIAKWASVQSVDFENGFCDVKVTGDDLPMYDVLLGFGNWKLKPKVETRCIVLEMEGRATAGVLIFAEEVETIEINGNQFGGLVDSKELKTQIDKNTQLLKAIQNVFKAFVPVPSDGGAALKAAASAFISLPTADLSNIENKTISHG